MTLGGQRSSLSDCRNILIRDVTSSNAPNWTLHLQGSEQAVISGIHINNDLVLPNNDGIDCMRCKHVHISDSDIRTGDDDFAIVSSEDVDVSNCSLFSYSAAIRLEDTRYSTFNNLVVPRESGARDHADLNPISAPGSNGRPLSIQ